jgi:hypothetical protein
VKRLLLISILGFAACKGRQAAVTPPPVVNDAPAWVRSRPVSDAYYIGIGMCPKSRPDFQESAKKNALNDLASEISVRVEGNSLLSTLDTRKQFSESFNSSIRTTTNEQLEGFELVETWESAQEQWTYYRLSKAEHARIKAERKQAAVNSALDLFARAQVSLAAGDLRTTIDQDLRSLLAMKAYWGENDKALIGDREVPVVNEVYGHLQRTVSEVRLTALPERIKLDQPGHFRREVLLTARRGEGRDARDLAQLPLELSYPGLNGRIAEKKSTDSEGRMRTTVQRVQLDAQVRELLVSLDMDALVSRELEPAFTKPLIASLTVPQLHVAIDVAMPRVFVQANETNMGQPVGDAGAAMAIKEELTTKGFRFVDNMNEADLLMRVTGTTREGGEASGFHTAFLDLGINFRDRRSGETIYEGGRQGIKGIQLTYPKAGMEAYKKAAQELRGAIVTAMLEALL